MRIAALTRQALGRAKDGTLVPRTLPGEEVEVEEETLRVLAPSQDRVAAPCRHYRSCGGCALQHASDAFVAGWKADVVRNALAAQGLTAEIAGVETSPPETRRRAKFSARRTKKGALVGFHMRASDQIVAVPDCLVLRPALRALLPALEELTRDTASRKGELALTVTDSVDGADLLVEGGPELDGPRRVALAGWAERHGIARLTWGDEPVVARSAPSQTFGPARVVPPSGAFLQATAEGEAALVGAVLSALEGTGRVLDLFAGCGTFSFPLARTAAVHAVEGAPEMIAALETAARRTSGLKPVTAEARDLFRRPLEGTELKGFDGAVIDPPRAGAAAQVAALAEAGPAIVAMVSCNPASFARDAAALIAAGYGMGPITVVDQFRWSSHVELVARFSRG